MLRLRFRREFAGRPTATAPTRKTGRVPQLAARPPFPGVARPANFAPAAFLTKPGFHLTSTQHRLYSKQSKGGGPAKNYVRQQGNNTIDGKDPRYLTDAERGQLEQTRRRRNNKGRGVEGKYVYRMEGLSKYIEGDKPLFENLNLQIWAGAKVGVLGVNGSGKSSLIKIIAGVDKEFDGSARTLGGAKVGYLPQEPQLDQTKNVRDNILDGVKDKKAILDKYKALKPAAEAGTLSDDEKKEFDKLKRRVDDEDLEDIDWKVEAAMYALRCPPGDSSVTKLSGGERKRVALCKVLLSSPDILLLDEVTNHLSNESVAWIEQFLANYKGCVIAVTHDRYFLDNVAGWILEIDRGGVYPFEGNYSEWLMAKQTRLEQEAKKEHARTKFMKQELDWINAAPKARQSKQKARVDRYDKLLSEARNRAYETGQIVIPPGPRLTKHVIKVENVSKSYGDRVLFKNVNLDFPPGAIVGIVGPNGVGKSTLFNIITGHEQPDDGTISIGENVQMGYITQFREMDEESTVFDEIAAGDDWIDIGENRLHVRHYLAGFNIKGTLQDRKVSELSGGERNRLFMAKMLAAQNNVLLLDEPSNDFDVDTLRSLEEAILEFAGTAVIISHDRWFLDRLCTHIVAFEGENVVCVEGTYADYEADRKKRGVKNRPAHLR